jgi:cation transport protein ChaC
VQSRPAKELALMTDAFKHLPALRGRITPPEKSELRATREVLALWDERARSLGRATDWRLCEQAIEDSRKAVLGDLDLGAGLWIYGYGSLMWDPSVHIAEVRRADLPGHQRRFNFQTDIARGSAELLALMLSLEPGAGLCQGLAFHIGGDLAEAESAILWRREMIRGSYTPVMLPVATPQGEIAALVFASNAGHHDYVGELPLQATAAIIASAAGVMGTNRDYLEQLARQLAALEIHDDYVAQLVLKVREISGG